MATTLASSSEPVQQSNGSAGPKRWRPTKHLTEAPIAPPLDHRIQEEANATAAAQAAGFEGRRVRRFLQRRTVDYHSGMLRWSLVSCVARRVAKLGEETDENNPLRSVEERQAASETTSFSTLARIRSSM